LHFDHVMFMLEIYECIRCAVDILYMHDEFGFCLRRSVYFLNICYICVFYRFNRNMALQQE
jgi:hypothetical protein